MNNDTLLKAYSLYQDEFVIISTITDYDYISFTEIAQLFNKILNVNCLEARHIRYLLLDNNVIKRASKKHTNSLNQFIVNKKCEHFCNEIQYKSTKFYVWDARLIFALFGLNLNHKVTKEITLKFCKIAHRYTQKYFDVTTVSMNLKYLQLVIFHHLGYAVNSAIED